MTRWAGAAALAGVAVLVAALPAAASGVAPQGAFEPATRVSTSASGGQAAGRSTAARTSGTGRYVVFQSDAPLTRGDAGGTTDAFWKDLTTGAVRLVSRSSAGVSGDFGSTDPSVDDAGRVVVFTSAATNLVPGDTNQAYDVFAHVLATGVTTRVSVTSSGGQGALPRDAQGSSAARISADGRYVTFVSDAGLVDGDRDRAPDVYVHDLVDGSTSRVSGPLRGNPDPAPGFSYKPTISGDGRFVAFCGSDGDRFDPHFELYVRDRTRRQTTRVTHGSRPFSATGCDPELSRSGRYLAYHDTPDEYDGPVVVLDLVSGAHDTTQLLGDPALSGDGRFVVGRTRRGDVAVLDRSTGTTTPLSRAPDGSTGNGSAVSDAGAVSGDGRVVVFSSTSSDLVAGDTNDQSDVFARRRR